MHNFFQRLGLVLLCLFYSSISLLAEAAQVSEAYRQSYYTSIAASSCLGVYNPEVSPEFNYLRSYGWQIAPEVTREGKVESNFAIARNYFPEEGKLVYLVTFRGSASRKDWDLNIKTKWVNYGGHTLAEMQQVAAEPTAKNIPAVHKGFNLYTENVLKNSVLNAQGSLRGLFQDVKEREDVYLILTGHSLGGAAATLLGERLIDLGVSPSTFEVITFGAPAIANAAFVNTYGQRMKLTRITNPNDPIPGSLQTFFNGYEQFGENKKYKLSTRVSSIQHAMALYFDESVADYHRQLDAEISRGTLQAEPSSRVEEDEPLVAVWFNTDQNLNQQVYGKDVRRFMLAEYKRMLPSYKIMSEKLQLNAQKYENLLDLSRQADADYMMVYGVELEQPRNENYGYLSLNQQVFDKAGHLVTMGTYAKKVGSGVSHIQAAGELLFEARQDLAKKLPFVKLQHQAPEQHF